MKKISLVLVIILICSTLGCAFTGIAFADSETVYTDVLEDLSKDETFDARQYPAKADDYSLTVFQIAESNAGELFLYVYQPAEDKFDATSVNISTAINESLHYANYKLTKLSKQGCLVKYIVNEFEIKKDAVRYYDVSAIFRKWYEDIDESASKIETNNTVSEVSFAVGKLYTACTVDGTVTYTEVHQDVIVVTGKYCGFVRYPDGFQLFPTACDSHFVAFSTDIKIDELYDADVDFIAQSYTYTYYDNDITGRPETIDKKYGEKIHNSVTVHSEEVSHKGNGWFAQKYTWNRIETVSEFKKNNILTNIAEKELAGKEWVLRFAETDFSKTGALTYYTEKSTLVSEVTILRLHFKAVGKVYNLGVVDNKQTGSDNPVNRDDETLVSIIQRILKWLSKNWKLLVIVIVVIAVAAALIVAIVKKGAAVVFTAIGKALWFAIKYLFIGIGYVVASPVLIIMAIVRAAKKNKQ